jgi:hypothetical protein
LRRSIALRISRRSSPSRFLFMCVLVDLVEGVG